MRLEFNLPKKSDPGFLRRYRNYHRAKAAWTDTNAGPDAGDNLIDFFLDYLAPGIDRAAARETLLDLSEDDFNAAMAQFTEAFEGKASSPAAKSSAKSTAASGPTRGRQRTGRSS